MERLHQMATVPGLALVVGAALWGCGDSTFFADDSSEPSQFPRSFDSSTESGPDARPPLDDRPEFRRQGEQRPSGEIPRSGDVEPSRGIPFEDSRGSNDLEDSTQSPPQFLREPIVSRTSEHGELVVENVIETSIPYAAYIHVHDRGVLFVPLDSVGPGEAEIVPAPKESPDEVVERLKRALTESGYSDDRAETIVERKRGELFGQHGSRVGFVSPDSWVEQSGQGPLGGVVAPAPPWK